jgi:hypothetical protein
MAFPGASVKDICAAPDSRQPSKGSPVVEHRSVTQDITRRDRLQPSKGSPVVEHRSVTQDITRRDRLQRFAQASFSTA